MNAISRYRKNSRLILRFFLYFYKDSRLRENLNNEFHKKKLDENNHLKIQSKIDVEFKDNRTLLLTGSTIIKNNLLRGFSFENLLEYIKNFEKREDLAKGKLELPTRKLKRSYWLYISGA